MLKVHTFTQVNTAKLFATPWSLVLNCKAHFFANQFLAKEFASFPCKRLQSLNTQIQIHISLSSL